MSWRPSVLALWKNYVTCVHRSRSPITSTHWARGHHDRLRQPRVPQSHAIPGPRLTCPRRRCRPLRIAVVATRTPVQIAITEVLSYNDPMRSAARCALVLHNAATDTMPALARTTPQRALCGFCTSAARWAVTAIPAKGVTSFAAGIARFQRGWSLGARGQQPIETQRAEYLPFRASGSSASACGSPSA